MLEIIDEKGKNVCYDFVRSISFTLYEQNIVDSRLAYYLKKEAFPKYITGDESFIVSCNDLRAVLARRFSHILSEHFSTNPELRPRKVDSVTLVHKLLKFMPNLKMVRVRVSKERNYTRETPDQKSIEMDYRVNTAVLDPVSYVGDDVMPLIKQALINMGYLRISPFYCPSYVRVNAKEFENSLEPYLINQPLPGAADSEEGEEEFEEEDPGAADQVDPYNLLKMLLNPKFVQDDSDILIMVKG